MIKQYECLDCRAIKDFKTLIVRRSIRRDLARVACGECGSLKLTRYDPITIDQFVVDGFQIVSCKDIEIDAMTEQQRKLEEITKISDRLAIDLVDIYIQTNNLVNGLTLLENHNYSFVDMSIKELEKNNVKLLNLIETIKLINKICEN
jgi:hypothetical protein